MNFLWSRYKRSCRSGLTGDECNAGKLPALRQSAMGNIPKFLDAPDVIGAERGGQWCRREVGGWFLKPEVQRMARDDPTPAHTVIAAP